MSRGQRVPEQWRILLSPTPRHLAAAVAEAERSSGILVIGSGAGRVAASTLLAAKRKGISIVREGRRCAVRVHDVRELTRALGSGAALILLSPIYPTATHPDWKPLPRMQAAALARLAARRLVALGGMDASRFARVQRLGFKGWAGIGAFRT